MLRIHSLFLLLLLFWTSPNAQAASDKLKVVATIPDIADLVRTIGGDNVEVTTICTGSENVHAVHLRPSHVVATSRCDLFCQVGLSLEHAWVPGLLQTARNPKIQPGNPGLLTVSAGFEVIDVPKDLSRQNGADLHPEGNPHINLAQTAGRKMGQAILDKLIELDPADRATFEANFRAFEIESKKAEKRWAALGEKLEGKVSVTYHSEFNYLLAGLGVKVLATIEPKPGVPPTPGHLSEVLEAIGKAAAADPTSKIPVLTAAWSNNRSVDRVVEGSPQCVKCLLSSMTPDGKSWLDSMEERHKRLAEAFGVPYPEPESQSVPARELQRTH